MEEAFLDSRRWHGFVWWGLDGPIRDLGLRMPVDGRLEEVWGNGPEFLLYLCPGLLFDLSPSWLCSRPVVDAGLI